VISGQSKNTALYFYSDPKYDNPLIAAMAERLEARGMAPKAIVGASMRRLIHMIYGVLKSNTFFNAEMPMRGLAIQDGI